MTGNELLKELQKQPKELLEKDVVVGPDGNPNLIAPTYFLREESGRLVICVGVEKTWNEFEAND